MLDKRSGAWLLNRIDDLLVPGGQVLFYETNPLNVILKIRRMLARLWRRDDPRLLLTRPDLYELLSEVRFIRIFAVFNDFVYAPLSLTWWILRNLSIVLENMPGVRTLAGSILLYAQRPPHSMAIPHAALTIDDRFRRAVSVVVPCHNEEMTSSHWSRSCVNFTANIHEIILVDEIATMALASYWRSRGRGSSDKTGLPHTAQWRRPSYCRWFACCYRGLYSVARLRFPASSARGARHV